MIIIRKPEDLEQYFDKRSYTYNLFSPSDMFGEFPTAHFECDINVIHNILAPIVYAGSHNIKCSDLTCMGIDAHTIYCSGNLIVSSGSIRAYDIHADNIIADFDIDASEIVAESIQAISITAKKIKYYSVCCTEDDLRCESIAPQLNTSKHFSLKGNVIIGSKNKETR